ncbi:hypothetical protein GGX14DRAFT_407973 [Mycena pura]|uniref:Uncharacterized protein n=1 Tax=Mycena pura TaxID=153505 RepID=A0AAD6UMK2_9AGAR|nr:hypothetical protein GGX14DRAFT_407973 [Mycena pura]
MSTVPLISQLKSLWQFVTGDSAGAKKTQEEFLDAWEHNPGKQIEDILENVPVVGNAIGLIHLAMHDEEGFWRAEEAATRTMIVMGAGALAVGTGGVASPILAGVVAGIAADVAITGVESHRHHKFDPQGYIAAFREFKTDWRSAAFDVTALVVGDGWIGKEGGIEKHPTNTTRVMRVEGNGDFLSDKRGRIPGPVMVEPLYGNNAYLYPLPQGLVEANPELLSLDPRITGLNPDNARVHLTLNDVSRSEVYYAQKLIQYRSAVERWQRMKDLGYDVDVQPTTFNLRMKSFRVLSSDPSVMRFRDTPERPIPGEHDRNRGRDCPLYRVDQSVTNESYACKHAVYAPLLEKAIPGSYEEIRIKWIEHLPTRVLRLMENNPTLYRRVRFFVVPTHMFGKEILKANVGNNITDKEWSRLTSNNVTIPLSILNDEGVDRISVEHYEPARLRQSRQVKCGRRLQGEEDHGEHMEYLVEFWNNARVWVPAVDIDVSLKREFWEARMDNAQEIAEVLESDPKSGTLRVRRPDGREEVIDQDHIFWHEEETPTPITPEELQGLMHHGHYGTNNFHEEMLCQLEYESDWACLTITDKGAVFVKDPQADAVGEYNGWRITPTELEYRVPDFGKRTIPIRILSNGAPFNMMLNRGPDAEERHDGRGSGRFDIMTLAQQTIMSSGIVYPPIQTPGLLILRLVNSVTIQIYTLDTTIEPDTTVDPSTYNTVDFEGGRKGTILRARKAGDRPFIVPFVIHGMYEQIEFTVTCEMDPYAAGVAARSTVHPASSSNISSSLADSILGDEDDDAYFGGTTKASAGPLASSASNLSSSLADAILGDDDDWGVPPPPPPASGYDDPAVDELADAIVNDDVPGGPAVIAFAQTAFVWDERIEQRTQSFTLKLRNLLLNFLT